MSQATKTGGAGARAHADVLRVFSTTRLPQASLQRLPDSIVVQAFDAPRPISPETLARTLRGGDFDGLICTYKDRIDDALLAASPRPLRFVATLSAGEDHIDHRACAERDIVVINAPDCTTDSVADYGIALILLGLRRLDRFLTDPPSGPWHYLWECRGAPLSRATVGIVGLGAIGEAISRRLHGFKCRLQYSSRSRKPALEEELGLVPLALPELLRTSTVVVLCCALTPETRHLFDRGAFRLLRPGSVLVNLARGEIVDHDALLEGLNDARPATAILDTTDPEPLPEDHPLRRHKSCLVFPHIATNTASSRRDIADHVFGTILALSPGSHAPGL